MKTSTFIALYALGVFVILVFVVLFMVYYKPTDTPVLMTPNILNATLVIESHSYNLANGVSGNQLGNGVSNQSVIRIFWLTGIW